MGKKRRQVRYLVGELLPVDGVNVAHFVVTPDVHGAPDHLLQPHQSNLLQVFVLKNDQGVVAEQRVAANDGQIGEDVLERLEAGHAVNQQVLGDFTEIGEA